MNVSDRIAILNFVATGIAILLAPIIALWIGGVLQARSTIRQQRLSLLSLLLSLRHRPLSPEVFEALNLIDVTFVDKPKVREAWSKYYAAMNDNNLNVSAGFAVRDEKRRDLTIAIVECLGLQKKITTADLLRTYVPTAVIETEFLILWERIKRRTDLRAEFIERGIGFPDYIPPVYPIVPPVTNGHITVAGPIPRKARTKARNCPRSRSVPRNGQESSARGVGDLNTFDIRPLIRSVNESESYKTRVCGADKRAWPFVKVLAIGSLGTSEDVANQHYVGSDVKDDTPIAHPQSKSGLIFERPDVSATSVCILETAEIIVSRSP